MVDTCDAHLENALEFNFEDVDSDTEKRVNEPDLLPLDPEKEERLRKMKMGFGFFLRKTKWRGIQEYLYHILRSPKRRFLPIRSDQLTKKSVMESRL